MEKVKAKLVKFKRWLVASVTILIVFLASFFAIPILFPPTPSTGYTAGYYALASDGSLRSYSAVNYATAWNATSANFNWNTTTYTHAGQWYTGTYYVHRACLYFDTSALPDNVSVSQVSLYLNISTDSSTQDFNLTVWKPELYQNRPNNPCGVADYNYLFYDHAKQLASYPITSPVLKEFINVTFNDTQCINTRGITTFVLRSDREVLGVAPTTYECVQWYSYESGQNSGPLLAIFYDYPPESISLVPTINWRESGDTYYLAMVNGEGTTWDMLDYISNIDESVSTNWQTVLRWTANTAKFGTACENQTKIQWALLNATMLTDGSCLPKSSYDGTGAYFSNHDSDFLYGYNYSAKYSYQQAKWNMTTAFANYNALYAYIGNRNGWLWYRTNTTYYASPVDRYYDENAETMRTFILFYTFGAGTTALTSAKSIWSYLNTFHWVTTEPRFFNYENYTQSNFNHECSGGAFLQIAEWLKYIDDSTGNISRLIEDGRNRYLIDLWDSPQWTYGATRAYINIHSHESNPQHRLHSSVYAWASLFGMYDLLSSQAKQNMSDLLTGYVGVDPLWKLLRNATANVFNGTMFSITDNGDYTNYATALGASLSFMVNIVPINGTLAIPIEELSYEYQYHIFDPQLFNISVDNRVVQISVLKAGWFKFIFNGAVYQQFTQNGTYKLQFNTAWTGIDSATRISDLPTRRFLSELAISDLSVGWNNVTLFEIDVDKTLGRVNESLNSESINWSVLTVDYGNGTQWSLVYGTHFNSEKLIASTSNVLYIYCNAVGTWGHDYP